MRILFFEVWFFAFLKDDLDDGVNMWDLLRLRILFLLFEMPAALASDAKRTVHLKVTPVSYERAVGRW